jgi:hypothetical protein
MTGRAAPRWIEVRQNPVAIKAGLQQNGIWPVPERGIAINGSLQLTLRIHISSRVSPGSASHSQHFEGYFDYP